MKNKVTAMLLALCMVVTMMPTIVLAAPEFSDMPNDYSTKALEAAVENGLLKGAGGKISPNDNLTRAQLAAILVRAFGAKEAAALSAFTDVSADEWYYKELGAAVHMGIFKGDGTTMRPNAGITRQEAFLVLSRAFSLIAADTGKLDTFADKAQVAAWAKDGVAAMVATGYVKGDGVNLRPLDNISRKDFAVTMDRMVKNYISKSGIVTELAEGNVMVNVPNVTLKDVTVKGNLIIGDGVGAGDITLENVKVEGKTIVRGGGVNSFVIKGNSSVGSIVIAKVDGNVRVAVEGSTQVEIIEIADGKDDVIIEGKVGKLEISAETPVQLNNAEIKNVTVTAPNANVTVGQGTKIEAITATKEAEGAKLEVSKGAVVKTLNAAAEGMAISGAGTLENANVTGNNAKINTTGTTVKVAEGVTGTTAGDKSIAGGTTEKTGGSTGGGSYVPQPTVATAIAQIAKPTWNAATPNKDNVNKMMTALWTDTDENSDVEAFGFSVVKVFTASGNTLTVNVANVTENLKTWIKTQWGGTSVPVALTFNGEIVKGVAADQNWSGAYLAWIDLSNDGNGSKKATIDGTAFVYTVTVIGGKATEITYISQPVWYPDTQNGDNVNKMMSALWTDTEEGSDVEAFGFNVGKVFTASGSTLTVNVGNVTESLKTWINTQWGGTSVPVELFFNGKIVNGVDRDQNWSGAYLAWIDLSNDENGTTVVTLKDTAFTYKVTVAGGRDVATEISNFEQPIWMAETPNKDKVNKMMTALWTDTAASMDEEEFGFNVEQVFTISEKTLVVNVSKVTENLKTWIKTQWGGTSVPVALIFNGEIVKGVTADQNWSGAYLAWIDLSNDENGTTGITLKDTAFTYKVTVAGGRDAATEISNFEQPIWNAETPNAENVNKMMTALWTDTSASKDEEDFGFNVEQVFKVSEKTLVVDVSKVTENLKTWIGTQWGGTSVPVALTFNGEIVKGVTADQNWSGAYLAWIDLSNDENGTTDVTLKDTAFTYKVTVAGGRNAADKITDIKQPKWNAATPNADNVNKMMDALWTDAAESTDEEDFGFNVKQVFTASGNTLTVNAGRVTESLKTWIKTQWGGASVPVALIFNGKIVNGVDKDQNWSGAYLAWIDLSNDENGTTSITLKDTAFTYKVTVTGGRNVANAITDIKKPEWNAATPNADNVNKMMDALWTDTEDSADEKNFGFNVGKVFTAEGRTLTVHAANVTDDLKTWIDTQWGGTSVPVALTFNGEIVKGVTADQNWSGAYLAWIDLSKGDSSQMTIKIAGTECSYTVFVTQSL